MKSLSLLLPILFVFPCQARLLGSAFYGAGKVKTSSPYTAATEIDSHNDTYGFELGWATKRNVALGFRYQSYFDDVAINGVGQEVDADFFMLFGTFFTEKIHKNSFFATMMLGDLNLQNHGRTADYGALGFALGYQFILTHHLRLSPEASLITPMTGDSSFTLISGQVRLSFVL